MIIIADNSPLSALSEIGLIDLLPSLYDGVSSNNSGAACNRREQADTIRRENRPGPSV